MTTPVTLPLWLFALIVAFAGAAFATNFLFPSVRWFLRRRMQRAVDQLNDRLQVKIEPFKLLRRYDLIQRLVYDPDVTAAIVEHAREEGVREDVAFQRARKYAREIVPSFSAFTYFGWGVRLARLMSNAMYRVELRQLDADALTRIDPHSTVVFVMNHRSNMDYVLVTHLVADRSALSYAVGEWARVWPLSRLIRSMGAYFIRRKDRDALYRRVLRRYVQMSTEGGVTQAIFPEGGLSLDGGLARPKVGLLSYIVEANAKMERDVVFVPVALNYDRVLEDTVLVKAGLQGQRRFEARIGRVMAAALRMLWRRITGRANGFGTAAVTLGRPLSLARHPELAIRPEALARELMGRITEAVPVLPVPVIADELLRGPRDRSALAEAVKAAKAEVHHLEEMLDALIRRGILREIQGQISIAPGAEAVAQFYARSIAQIREVAGAVQDTVETARSYNYADRP
jgi:glycerol-3-phosphate O-acyltransferase